MRTPSFCCLFVAVFTTALPYSPSTSIDTAQHQLFIGDKIATLKKFLVAYPSAPDAATARDQLVELLAESNRYEEALQLYRENLPPLSDQSIDLRLDDYLLKTGRYAEVLRDTNLPTGPIRDFVRDLRLLELQVQALLAKGRYQTALASVDRWLVRYSGDGIEGGRFEGDVKSIQFLRRHLATLIRMQGPEGKPIYTASVPDRLQQWSHQQDVPIVFFKLIPSHASGQLYEPVLPGRYEVDDYFQTQVDEINKGFGYLSGDTFSLKFSGLHTLYVKNGDLDPSASGGHLLTSRVYLHTIPDLYQLAGQAFVVLVDYRAQAVDEAAYVGDGLIHISASKFQTMIVMHEILHGLGATHQEWNPLESQGYRFDPDDRGLMTFDQGEIRDLGLEEKNRALLGWPHVAVIHLSKAVSVVTPTSEKLSSKSKPSTVTPEIEDDITALPDDNNQTENESTAASLTPIRAMARLPI